MKEYLKGTLLSVLLLVIGVLADEILGRLQWSLPRWPDNLIGLAVVLAIILIVGISSGAKWKQSIQQKPIYLPATVLMLLAVLIWVLYPVQEVNYQWVTQLYSGFFFQFLYLFLLLSYSLSIVDRFKKISFKKAMWCISALGFLLLTTSVILGHFDYYHMSMRIGKDRAIFSGENYDGLELRTPFAAKLIDTKKENGTKSTVRLFETVTNFNDFQLDDNNSFSYKGWTVRQLSNNEQSGSLSPLMDLQLIFDRWKEARLVGLMMMMVGWVFFVSRGKP